MLTIALDAMGGDHAPVVEVEGAVLAARQYGVKVILVGLADRVRAELEKYDDYRDLPIEVVHASERITMDDPTTAVRTTGRRRDWCRPATLARRWLRPKSCKAWCRV